MCRNRRLLCKAPEILSKEDIKILSAKKSPNILISQYLSFSRALREFGRGAFCLQ